MKHTLLFLLLMISTIGNLEAQKLYHKSELLLTLQDQKTFIHTKDNHEPISGFVKIQENSRKYSIANLRDGVYDGIYQEFVNGSLAVKGKYQNGRKIDTWMEYFPNGTIWSNKKYSKGELNGEVLYYYNNGNIERSIEYVLGKRNGKELRYTISGELSATYLYHNDILHGKYWKQETDAQGTIYIIHGEYKDGNKHGNEVVEIISSKGEKLHRIKTTYDKGQKISDNVRNR